MVGWAGGSCLLLPTHTHSHRRGEPRILVCGSRCATGVTTVLPERQAVDGLRQLRGSPRPSLSQRAPRICPGCTCGTNQTWSTPSRSTTSYSIPAPRAVNVSSLLRHSRICDAVRLDRHRRHRPAHRSRAGAKMAKLPDEAEAGCNRWTPLSTSFRSLACAAVLRDLAGASRRPGAAPMGPDTQSAPDVDNPVSALFFLASSRIFIRRKGVRTCRCPPTPSRSRGGTSYWVGHPRAEQALRLRCDSSICRSRSS